MSHAISKLWIVLYMVRSIYKVCLYYLYTFMKKHMNIIKLFIFPGRTQARSCYSAPGSYSRANLAKWFHIKTQAAHSTQSEFWVMTTVLCIARCASIFSVDHFCVDLPHWNLAVFLTFCHWRWVTKLNLYYYNLYIYLIKLLYISQSG